MWVLVDRPHAMVYEVLVLVCYTVIPSLLVCGQSRQ